MVMVTNAEPTAKARRQRRESGMREVRFWLPDLRDPKVRAQLEADLEAMRGHPSIEDGNQFTDAALADMDDWRA